MRSVRSGIDRRIALAVGTGFALVLLVGGVSVVLAWRISRDVEEGRRQSLEVEAISRIHTGVQHAVADLHLAPSGQPVPGHRSPAEALAELQREVTAYRALEHAQEGPQARHELRELDNLAGLVAHLESVALRARPGAPPATRADLERLNGVLHDVTEVMEDLHALHRRKFERSIDLSQQRLLLISSLYVAFALGGGGLLLLGNRYLSRTLVVPIQGLGRAAHQIASGNLTHRVPVRSLDEIGQLSRAFNLMAERLEVHEVERLNFEAELERQVKDRTRELEETAARLRATQADLLRSERIAVTGQIAAGVTHEIRTPLNALAINVQLFRRELAQEEGVPPTLREILAALTGVEYEITRINGILEEFVNFARPRRPALEPVEIGVLAQEILGLVGPQAAATGIAVEPLRGEAVPPVRGDKDQLRQVLLNLAQNAIQAMPAGGVLGLTLRRDGSWVEIVVTDSGPGVPEGERQRIFLPFVSTKESGLGLGLAIVRRIVEEHGGTVACHSRAEGGAAFTVRLPGGSED